MNYNSSGLVEKNYYNNSISFKYMRFLSIIYVTFLMAATVMAYKVANIWGVSEPGSTLIYTFTFFLGNVYAEIYGLNNTKKLIWESVIAGYIFAGLITLVISLPSPEYWDLKIEFEKVLGHTLRFTNAGVIGYLLSAFLNAYLVTKWKYKLKGRFFMARSLMASSISEGAATFVAGLITFFGMMPTRNILILMLSALLFKIFYGFIAVWPATFIAFLLKKKEKEVTRNTSFNPFNIKDE